MKKIKESIEYYRANPLEWLEDFFPDIKLTPFQKKVFEVNCKRYREINSQEKAERFLACRGGQIKHCFEHTLATMLNSSTIGGKSSNEVEINGFKCNI